MILEISNGTDSIRVEITSNRGNRKIRLGGTEIMCDWIRLADGHYSLILDGSVLDVLVNVETDSCSVTSHAGTYSFRIMDPRRAGARDKIDGGFAGVQRVCADMPGKIIRVLVREGDAIEHDQILLVLEAMKMQNEIRAPKTGIIKQVSASPGTAVNTGDFLLSIE